MATILLDEKTTIETLESIDCILELIKQDKQFITVNRQIKITKFRGFLSLSETVIEYEKTAVNKDKVLAVI